MEMCLVATAALLAALCGGAGARLSLVQIVFRHGDRTPTASYTGDPHANYPWPGGFGALTNKGKAQLYELGQRIRANYSDLLAEAYSPDEVFVQSSDSDRCHMSALTLLAGLYPPPPEQRWHDSLSWQPVPVHSLPRHLDNLVAQKRPCSRYEEELRQTYESDEVLRLRQSHADVFEAVIANVGPQEAANITAIEFLYNTLYVEENAGLRLPEWTRPVYPDRMRELAVRSLALFSTTEYMRRMKGGVLLRQATRLMVEKTQRRLQPDRKLFLYSGHDITLVNVLRTLGVPDLFMPDYGAWLVMELHEDDARPAEVKLIYYDSYSNQNPIEVQGPICGSPCTLDTLLRSLSPFLPGDDWEAECSIK